jgi:Na+/H+-dicarboxylate symporter
MISSEQLKKIKLPLYLISVLLLPLFFGHSISLEIKSIFYAISLSMKSILEFVLPFIIFSFIFNCLLNLQKGALFFVLLLVVCVFVSNFSALMYSYAVATFGIKLLHFKEVAIATTAHLDPAWNFHLVKLIPNDNALLCGFICGIFFSFVPSVRAKKVAVFLNNMANTFLRKAFIPVLPLFILGFVFKLEYEQVLQVALKIYGPIILLIVASQWFYILSWYFVASQFSLKKWLFYIKNVLPASLTGFCTISSAATLPVLIISTEKNLQDSQKANMLVPAIVNIHTIGSAIGVPILSLATIAAFGLPMPSLSTFAIFALYVALAKYAVAAVPGGVMLVVAPILEAKLGFSSDMVGLVMAVYLICDPFGTTANVTANGAFPIIFTRLHESLVSINFAHYLGQWKIPGFRRLNNAE